MAVRISLSISQNSQDIPRNKSNVTVSVKCTWTYGSYNLTNPSGTLKIDGKSYAFRASFNTSQTTSGSTTLFKKTVDVVHNADGTKKLVCSALYHSEVSSGDVTASASKVLKNIPRASTIGASDANIGATSTLTISRKSSGYTHSVAYKFGALSGYITSSGWISESEVEFSDTSVAFTVPTAFYTQIPNAKAGPCTLTIRTYSGTTQIGDDQTCTFTATAAEANCKPTVSGTVEDGNALTRTLTGDASKLIRYHSIATCTITATAKNSATISLKKINGNTVSSDTLIVPGVDADRAVFEAQDSRGYSNIVTLDYTLIPYIKLTNNAVGSRTDPTSGNASLTVKGNYYNGSFGSVDNALEIKYRIGNGEFSMATFTISDNTYSAVVALSGLDYTQAHTVEVLVADKLESVTKSITIGKGIPVYDWGESDFSFHVPITILGYPACGIFDTSEKKNLLYNAMKTFTGKTGGAAIVTTYDDSDPSQYCISLVFYKHSILSEYTNLKNSGISISFDNDGNASISSGTVAEGHTLHYAVSILAAF